MAIGDQKNSYDVVQWNVSKMSWDKIMEMGDVKYEPGPMGSGTFIISTLEGDQIVKNGDFVIKREDGEFSLLKYEIFQEMRKIESL